ncbi:MAG: hypothetical protein C0432_03675 [Candidatus Puniceispirillum sp.]|nr:hypothetical protein [Candidatus Pelagibacter sp.]MBA4283374.1 hypothetical protein [Candidatus Puniceispirillum sp.]
MNLKLLFASYALITFVHTAEINQTGDQEIHRLTEKIVSLNLTSDGFSLDNQEKLNNLVSQSSGNDKSELTKKICFFDVWDAVHSKNLNLAYHLCKQSFDDKFAHPNDLYLNASVIWNITTDKYVSLAMDMFGRAVSHSECTFFYAAGAKLFQLNPEKGVVLIPVIASRIFESVKNRIHFERYPNMCDGQPAEFLDCVISQDLLSRYEQQLRENLQLIKRHREMVKVLSR